MPESRIGSSCTNIPKADEGFQTSTGLCSYEIFHFPVCLNLFYIFLTCFASFYFVNFFFVLPVILQLFQTICCSCNSELSLYF
ncbi:hypothetical protein C5167_041431, partial [Papaver somniferum]